MSVTKQRMLAAIRKRRKLKASVRKRMVSSAYEVRAAGALFTAARADSRTKPLYTSGGTAASARSSHTGMFCV